jgi:hypothetical protein
VRRVGEHVHGLHAQDAEAGGDGERQLAGERLGVARDEDPAGGLQAAEDLADDPGRAALARRIEDHGLEVARAQPRQRLLHGGADELHSSTAVTAWPRSAIGSAKRPLPL